MTVHDKRRITQVKELFEKVNGAFVGWRLAELDDALSLPPLRLAALSGFDIHAEHENRLVQALPREPPVGL